MNEVERGRHEAGGPSERPPGRVANGSPTRSGPVSAGTPCGESSIWGLSTRPACGRLVEGGTSDNEQTGGFGRDSQEIRLEDAEFNRPAHP